MPRRRVDGSPCPSTIVREGERLQCKRAAGHRVEHGGYYGHDDVYIAWPLSRKPRLAEVLRRAEEAEEHLAALERQIIAAVETATHWMIKAGSSKYRCAEDQEFAEGIYFGAWTASLALPGEPLPDPGEWVKWAKEAAAEIAAIEKVRSLNQTERKAVAHVG